MANETVPVVARPVVAQRFAPLEIAMVPAALAVAQALAAPEIVLVLGALAVAQAQEWLQGQETSQQHHQTPPDVVQLQIGSAHQHLSLCL
jgi:hypothetical protein